MTAERVVRSTTVERVHAHNWHQLSPAVRAAIERELAKTRPAEDLDPEHCRRVATLLGLRPDGEPEVSSDA